MNRADTIAGIAVPFRRDKYHSAQGYPEVVEPRRRLITGEMCGAR